MSNSYHVRARVHPYSTQDPEHISTILARAFIDLTNNTEHTTTFIFDAIEYTIIVEQQCMFVRKLHLNKGKPRDTTA